jgi:type I restriction enzyme S subunit
MRTGDLLPTGWAVASLQDCSSRISDGTHIPPKFTEQGVPFVFVKHIVGGTICFEDTKFISPETYEELHRRNLIELGDILYSAVGSYGVAVPVLTNERFSFQRHIAHIKPHRCLNQRYLVHYLNSPYGLSQAHRVARGIAQKTVTLGDLRKFEVRIAPASEQARIVEKLEELLSDLNAGVVALDRAKANLKRYRAAVLKDAVEGALTEEWRANHPYTEPASKLLERILAERRRKWEAGQQAKFGTGSMTPPKNWQEKYPEPVQAEAVELFPLPSGWCWATTEQLSDATRPITYGVIKLGAETADGVPVLRCSNVRHLSLELDEVKKVAPEIAAEYDRTFLRGGEVLVNVRGTLGGVVRVPPACAGYNIAREVAMIAPVDPTASHTLPIFIGSSPLQGWLTRNTRGIAYTGINIEALKMLPIPLPPIAEQESILSEIEQYLSVIAATEDYLAASLKRAARLRQSILKEAFEGKLVPQDPNDEPSGVLLERIRQERATQPNGQKSPRGPRAPKGRRS